MQAWDAKTPKNRDRNWKITCNLCKFQKCLISNIMNDNLQKHTDKSPEKLEFYGELYANAETRLGRD